MTAATVDIVPVDRLSWPLHEAAPSKSLTPLLWAIWVSMALHIFLFGASIVLWEDRPFDATPPTPITVTLLELPEVKPELQSEPVAPPEPDPVPEAISEPLPEAAQQNLTVDQVYTADLPTETDLPIQDISAPEVEEQVEDQAESEALTDANQQTEPEVPQVDQQPVPEPDIESEPLVEREIAALPDPAVASPPAPRPRAVPEQIPAPQTGAISGGPAGQSGQRTSVPQRVPVPPGQTIQDFFVAQIRAVWPVDLERLSPQPIPLTLTITIFPDGFVEGTFNKTSNQPPERAINDYDLLAQNPRNSQILEAAKALVLAIRRAQPFRMPQDAPLTEPLTTRVGFIIGPRENTPTAERPFGSYQFSTDDLFSPGQINEFIEQEIRPNQN